MRKRDSVFSKDNSHIWGTVYGIPATIGALLIIFGGDGAKAFGFLLIAGVVGSWVMISGIELFHDWLE